MLRAGTTKIFIAVSHSYKYFLPESSPWHPLPRKVYTAFPPYLYLLLTSLFLPNRMIFKN